MWATEGHSEHEGITGVTFDSDGHRLVGTLYLGRGEEPKPTALLLRGCPGLALDAVAAISPRPLLIVHGTEDRRVQVEHARELRDRAGPGHRYIEVYGANHAFAWHRAGLRVLIASWLDETCKGPEG